MNDLKAIVDEQAECFVLWAPASDPQAKALQVALRCLHADIEGKSPEQCARETLETIYGHDPIPAEDRDDNGW